METYEYEYERRLCYTYNIQKVICLYFYYSLGFRIIHVHMNIYVNGDKMEQVKSVQEERMNVKIKLTEKASKKEEK